MVVSYAQCFAFAMLVSAAVVAQAAHTGSTPHPTGAVYIVHMEKSDSNSNNLEALHVQTLSSVFDGSQEKAKESILYSYTNAMNGFSAKLTPEQVAELSKKPGVLSVKPQGVAHLHPGKAGMRGKGV
ncbi:unnamed protein product [Calypogeia fissa]